MKQEQKTKENLNKFSLKIKILKENLHNTLVGQDNLVENLLVAMLAGGHILIEGVPGLAKTLAANALAKSISADFNRIQFTPDLLPSDLVGTEIFNQDTHKFSFKKGPLFSNIVLADEINRAPSKVQSALLEAMAEKQISVAAKTHKLPEFFMVLATQNPIEQEGTYNLPEASLDRFLLHTVITYPSFSEEMQILNYQIEGKFDALNYIKEVITIDEILAARKEAKKVHIDDSLKEYILTLVQVTRQAEKYDSEISKYIDVGVSPRASLALLQASQILALLDNSKFVKPEHIQKILPDVFRHRLLLNFNADSDNVTKDEIIRQIISLVAL